MNSRFVLGASWVVAVTLLGGCGDSGSGGNTQSGGATSGGFGGIGGFGGSGGSAATAGQAGSSGSAGAAASGGTAGSSGAGGSAGAAASGGGGTGGGGTGGGGTGGSAATAWVRTLNTAGDTELIDAVAWPAGGIVALGRTSAYGAGDSDLAVISIAADGGIRWAKSLGGTDRETPGGVTLTDSGDILVVGATYSHSPARWEDGWVIRLDGTGKTVWQKSIGTNSLEGFSSVLAIGGDRYLLGGTAGIKTVYSGWLVEINGSGTIQWQHHYDSPGRGLDVRSIVRSPNGDLTLVGTAAQFTSPNDVDGLLVRLDPARKILWSRAFSGPMQSSSQAVTLADALARSDGSVVVAGHVASPGDTSDKATAAVAFQVDSSGALKWSRTVSATGKTTRATGLVASGSGITLFGSTTAYAAGSTRRPLLLELSASGALQSQLGLGATYSAGLSGGTLAGAGELYGVGFDNQSSGSPRRWS